MLNTLKERHKKFLEYYAISQNISESAIKAGYSPQYANKEGRKLLNTAIRLQAQSIVNKASNQEITKQESQSVLKILGLTREQVVKRLNIIAFQDKDYSSALKVLMPVSKSIGYDISQQDTPNITIPVLNIVVDKTDMASSKDIVEGEIVR